jgi:hypothetical protein
MSRSVTFMPDIQFLRKRFYLDAGGVMRYVRSAGPAKAHAAAGKKDRDGYWYVSVMHNGKRKKLGLHRVVWSLANGRAVSDERQIDHDDKDRDHNLPGNLFARTVRANQLNKKKKGTGVCISGDKFRAKISVHGRTIHLGIHDCPKKANREYRLALAGKHPKCTREVLNGHP